MNNTKKAAALAYGNDIKILKVVASGKEKLALQIIQKAKDFNIPIFQNANLVNALINIDIDDEINEDSYLAVSKILIWLNESENKVQLSKQT